MNKPKIIVAASPNGLIGVDGKLPWRKKADLKRFKATTMGGTLVMGRSTWESIGRPLPGRKTFILSKSPPGTIDVAEAWWDLVSIYESLDVAISAAGENPIWIAGGAQVYTAALPLCDELDVTLVNEEYVHPNPHGVFKVTTIDWLKDGQVEGFKVASEEVNAEDPSLIHRTYVRV